MRSALGSFGLCFTFAACGRSPEALAPDAHNVRVGQPLTVHVIVTDLSCGASITADVRLEEDLTCSGDALSVDANGLKINLNGHTIRGNGTGNGITVRGRSDIVVHGGTVRNFTTGIFVAQSTGVVVKDNDFTANREAVFLNGASGNVVKANRAWQNTQRGIMLRPTTSGIVSTDNQVVDNTLTDNPSGILVFGQSENTLKANRIAGSSVGAFDLTGGGGSRNVIKENVLTSSAVGIKFGTGWTGNYIIGNTLASNTCGLAGPGVQNIYKDNVFTANTINSCP
jgi:parallel beta-helix repeat protein